MIVWTIRACACACSYLASEKQVLGQRLGNVTKNLGSDVALTL